MNKKIFENARFCPKGDIEANWNKAVGFVPLDKEIIIYKQDDSHSAARFKIGDGKTVVQDLPFSGANIDEIQQLIDEKGELLIEYVDNAVSGLASKEWVVDVLETTGVDIQQYIDNSVEGLASEEYVDKQVNTLEIQIDTIQTELTADRFITEASYTSRVTADGQIFLDGSKAVLKKVVGSTVACKNLFDKNKAIDGYEIINIETGELKENNLWFVTDYILVSPQTSYVVSGKSTGKAVLCFDKNKNIVLSTTDGNNNYFTTTSDTAFVRLNGFLTEKDTFQLEEGTVATEYQPYFTGLKSASFGGIESTNADRTETSTLDFPKTETPLGVTIDFENKKITDYGVDLVLTGEENIIKYEAFENSIEIRGLNLTDNNPIGVCTDADVVQSAATPDNLRGVRLAYGNIYWHGILAKLGFSNDESGVESFKSWLAQRYADGNPVTIRYVSSTLQSETDFTTEQSASGNEYTAYKGGTEKVLGNDNAEFGVKNTLMQEYDLTSIVSRIDTIESLAKGANQAISYDNYSTMVTTLNALTNDKYNVGQNVMIITLNVPDLWISDITEKAVEYTYTSDEDFVNALKTNGRIQVGYYVLSALETQKVDLTEYVKFTDYATANKAGVVRTASYKGVWTLSNGLLELVPATDTELKNRAWYMPITGGNLDKAVKVGLTANTETLTNEEKQAVASWIGSQSQNAPNTLVQRYSSGNIAVPLIPTADVHAVSKKYVDDKLQVLSDKIDENAVAVLTKEKIDSLF